VSTLYSSILSLVPYRTLQWGVSTPLANTVGSSDITCTGLVDHFHQSSNTPFYANGTSWNGTVIGSPNPSPSAGTSSHKVTIIIVCAVLGALVVLGLLLFFGGRARMQRSVTTQDTAPRTFVPPLSIDGRPEPAWGTDSYAQSTSAVMTSFPQTLAWEPLLLKQPLSDYNVHQLQHRESDLSMSSRQTMHNAGILQWDQSGSSSSSAVPLNMTAPPSNRPGGSPAALQGPELYPPSLFSLSQPPPSLPTEINYPNTGDPARFRYHSGPVTSSGSEYTRGPPSPPAVITRFSNPYPNDNEQTQSAKMAEARLRHVRSDPNTALSSASPTSGGGAQSLSRAQPPSRSNFESETETGIVIQHRDGGTVTELPPPYMDRSQLVP